MQFSVLMSVYRGDRAEDVSYALDSVLNQTVRPDQIVLVLDGPVSNELNATIAEYISQNDIIEKISLETNVGLGKALCIGLEHCKYEYIARMDSDDFSLPDRFEKQVEFLEKHPGTDVLGGQIAEYDSEMEKEIAIRTVPLSMNDIACKMKKRNGMNHVTVMYKKSAVLKSGSYMHCPFFEDYYLWCRMINKGCQFCNLEEILVNVRAGEEMYRRRGGKEYNAAIIGFEKKILSLGFINRAQYLLNVIIRIGVANMPNTLRGHLYQTKLRAKNQKIEG